MRLSSLTVGVLGAGLLFGALSGCTKGDDGGNNTPTVDAAGSSGGAGGGAGGKGGAGGGVGAGGAGGGTADAGGGTADASVVVDMGTPDAAAPVGYAADVKKIFEAKCAPCHTTGSSGTQNIGANYADAMKESKKCAPKNVAECALDRMKDGSMPLGQGCANNPTKAACPTQAQIDTVEAWIKGGLKP